MELCKIDLLTRTQNLVKLSLIVFELDALFSHVSSDGRSVGRTENTSHRGAPLLTNCNYIEQGINQNSKKLKV